MSGRLFESFDTMLFDLDGVVYAGSKALPGAAESIGRLKQDGRRIAYVTNNASRSPASIADQLVGLGVDAMPDEIVTSAQAGAGLLARDLPAGSKVLVVGGAGLITALEERGLVPVSDARSGAVAVVQGFHPSVGWALLAEGAYALANDLPWVATNVDRTIPTDYGMAPGNGTLVEVLKLATGREPVVAGKPERPLFEEAMARTGAAAALVIGDRLDTDIEGANNSGLPSLLVLTGVSTIRDLLLAPEAQRPTYVSSNLQGLFEALVPLPSVAPSPTAEDRKSVV